MNAEVFAEWFRRRGYRVLHAAGTHWFEVMPRVYQAIPYQGLIDPSDAEIRRLIHGERAVACRYSTAVEGAEGKLSYHVVNANKDYDLMHLSKGTRYDVRKGLRYAGVERISLSCLASQGWVLRQETIARQGRADAETAVWWRRLCDSAEGLPGFEAWGALRAGVLMASILLFTMDDWCIGLYQQCCIEALKTCVNNALTYSFTKEVLGRPSIQQVFYGLHSLDAEESLDTFKFRMGYTARPVRQRVVLRPWLRCLAHPTGYRLLHAARKRWPGVSRLAKAEGMFRFYLEGKKPLAEQTWPACLKEPPARPPDGETSGPPAEAPSVPVRNDTVAGTRV